MLRTVEVARACEEGASEVARVGDCGAGGVRLHWRPGRCCGPGSRRLQGGSRGPFGAGLVS